VLNGWLLECWLLDWKLGGLLSRLLDWLLDWKLGGLLDG
jgi:hypothetical protein